jgi:sulfite exporter TauE/SafE
MAEAPVLDGLLYFSTGFLMSLGHCLGMCGPLLGAVALAQQPRRPGMAAQVPGLLVYHGGRITSYALIGLAAGLVGSTARLGDNLDWQAGLSLFAGLLMVLLAAGLAGWLPTQRWVESSGLSRQVSRWLQRALQSSRPGSRLALGVANGFLPCGPVYAMALGALAAASPWLGAGAMALYGAGTLPVLLVFGLGAARLGPVVRSRLQGVGAVLVLVVGAQLMLRAAAAWGLVGHVRVGEVVLW